MGPGGVADGTNRFVQIGLAPTCTDEPFPSQFLQQTDITSNVRT